MKGPAPLPTHLKLLRGNPGQRNLTNRREPMPALPTKPPAPPKYLIGPAKEEWERIIVECYHLKLVTALDIHALAAYCAAFARWRTVEAKIQQMAERDLAMDGLIVKTQSGGGAPNPLILMADRACRDMVRYASEFGLTPAARSRINAPEATGPSKFDGLLAG